MLLNFREFKLFPTFFTYFPHTNFTITETMIIIKEIYEYLASSGWIIFSIDSFPAVAPAQRTIAEIITDVKYIWGSQEKTAESVEWGG